MQGGKRKSLPESHIERLLINRRFFQALRGTALSLILLPAIAAVVPDISKVVNPSDKITIRTNTARPNFCDSFPAKQRGHF